MTDIAPELLEKVQESFEAETAGLREEIKSGVKSYEEAYDYAIKVGEALSRSFGVNITPEVLPDGMMYYNIADKVVRPMLMTEYNLTSEAAVSAQRSVNKAAGIGIRPLKAEFDAEKAQGIIDRVSSQPFEEIKWILNEPVKTFSKNVVDQTIKKNVEFQGKSGLSPKIRRTALGDACEWCQAVAGTYSYPNVPEDVYRRHANCDCVVEYIDGGKHPGMKQNVWTKKWEDDEFITPQELVEKVKTKMAESKEKKDTAEQLKDIGFSSVDRKWLSQVDKELQTSSIAQLRELEDKFGVVQKGSIAVEVKKGRGGATTVQTQSSTTTILKFGRDSFSSKDTYLKLMRKDLSDGWCMPCGNDDETLCKYIITHEYGHIVQNSLIKDEMSVKMGTRADFARYYRNQIEDIARQIDPDYEPEKYTSGYIQDTKANNPGKYDYEFFAECFANSQLGEPNVLGQAMNQWLESRGYQ